MEIKVEKTCDFCGGVNRSLRSNFCTNKCYSANYYEKNKEKKLRQQKIRCEQNKEELCERMKEYRKENKERILGNKKKNYEENKEEILEKRKLHYLKNKEKLSRQHKKYREQNREKIDNQAKKSLNKIYAECEQGVIKDTLIHKVFDFLNTNPEAELKELKVSFYESNMSSLQNYYHAWVNITYERYQKDKEEKV